MITSVVNETSIIIKLACCRCQGCGAGQGVEGSY